MKPTKRLKDRTRDKKIEALRAVLQQIVAFGGAEWPLSAIVTSSTTASSFLCSVLEMELAALNKLLRAWFMQTVCRCIALPSYKGLRKMNVPFGYPFGGGTTHFSSMG